MDKPDALVILRRTIPGDTAARAERAPLAAHFQEEPGT
jgi:hypothetical protein